MDTTKRHSTAFRREDNRKLQVLMNKVLRLLTKRGRETPTSVLCQDTGMLSVHQKAAFSVICSIYKTLKNRKPTYNYERLRPREDLLHQYSQCGRIDFKLTISRDSYFYRGSRLFNMLPSDIKNVKSLGLFKKQVKDWIIKNISVKP